MKKLLMTSVAVAALVASPVAVELMAGGDFSFTASAQAADEHGGSGGRGGQGYRGGRGAAGSGGTGEGTSPGDIHGGDEHEEGAESGSRGKGSGGSGGHGEGEEGEHTDSGDHGGSGGSGGSGDGGGGLDHRRHRMTGRYRPRKGTFRGRARPPERRAVAHSGDRPGFRRSQVPIRSGDIRPALLDDRGAVLRLRARQLGQRHDA